MLPKRPCERISQAFILGFWCHLGMITLFHGLQGIQDFVNILQSRGSVLVCYVKFAMLFWTELSGAVCGRILLPF